MCIKVTEYLIEIIYIILQALLLFTPTVIINIFLNIFRLAFVTSIRYKTSLNLFIIIGMSILTPLNILNKIYCTLKNIAH